MGVDREQRAVERSRYHGADQCFVHPRGSSDLGAFNSAKPIRQAPRFASGGQPESGRHGVIDKLAPCRADVRSQPAQDSSASLDFGAALIGNVRVHVPVAGCTRRVWALGDAAVVGAATAGITPSDEAAWPSWLTLLRRTQPEGRHASVQTPRHFGSLRAVPWLALQFRC
jgi:hypothetical protein